MAVFVADFPHPFLLRSFAAPTVLVDRMVPGVPSLDAVTSDDRDGAKAIATQVLNVSNEPVGLVIGNPLTSVVHQRLLDVQDAMAEPTYHGTTT